MGDTIWKLKDISQKNIFVRKFTLDDADKGQSEVLNDFVEFKEGTKAKDIDKKAKGRCYWKHKFTLWR